MTELMNPIKIAAAGILADGLPKGNSYGETLAAGGIAALEARGWRLVHPDGVTDRMVNAAIIERDEPSDDFLPGDLEASVLRHAILVAPTYATPAAPQKE